jgi:predicted RNA binding protein YcfA (HicA-like mRNA interferase family)
MAHQLSRIALERWLLANGFMKTTGASGHASYTHPSGHKTTLPAHGPVDLTKKHVGMIYRTLERCGWTREALKAALQRL